MPSGSALELLSIILFSAPTLNVVEARYRCAKSLTWIALCLPATTPVSDPCPLTHPSRLYPFTKPFGDWRIDLTVADNRGLTAVHSAYVYVSDGGPGEYTNLPECRCIPFHCIEDKLGRILGDLAEIGSDLAEV